MSNQLDKYFQALFRLKSGSNTRVPKGTKITYDAVSLEAGLGKGSIKKSRPVFAELIAAIDHEKSEKARPVLQASQKIAVIKAKAVDLQDRLDAALAREISLLREVYRLKKELARLVGTPVRPIRGAVTPNRQNGQL